MHREGMSSETPEGEPRPESGSETDEEQEDPRTRRRRYRCGVMLGRAALAGMLGAAFWVVGCMVTARSELYGMDWQCNPLCFLLFVVACAIIGMFISDRFWNRLAQPPDRW